MFLESILPTLPSTPIETLVYVNLGIGIFLLFYATFIELEHRQDIIRILGAATILVYAFYSGNKALMWTGAAIFIGSAIQFVEILLGLHKHSPEDLKRYQKMWRIRKTKD